MGPGNRPVLPLGLGLRQADSQTLCLPQTKVWEIPLAGVSSQFSIFRLTVGFSAELGLLLHISRKSPHKGNPALTALNILFSGVFLLGWNLDGVHVFHLISYFLSTEFML